MSYREIVETVGNYRAVIELDEQASEPDYDGQGVVILCTPNRHGSGYDTELKAYDGGVVRIRSKHLNSVRDPALLAWQSEADKLEGALSAALYHEDIRDLDSRFTERYLRTYYGVVTFAEMGWGSDRLIVLVTAAMLERWGAGTGVDVTATAEQTLTDWQAYAAGDVWGVIIEERVCRHLTVTHADGTVTEDDDDEWAEVADGATWGHYGTTYAEEAAREALAPYRTVEVPS